MDDWTAEQVDAGGLTFDVWTTGPQTGEPVLMLHGFPETAASWRPVAPALTAAGLRLIAPNQRGYSPGARPMQVEAYATDRLVADAVALLDAYGLGSAHVVGHDWGAAVAWPLAASHPDRVRTLTAVSVPHLAAYGWALREDPDQQERSSYIGLFRTPGRAERLLLADGALRLRSMFGDVVPPELLDLHVGALGDPEALTAALSWYRAMGSALESTPHVGVPTTYVWSTEDEAVGRAGAERCGEFVDGPYDFVVLDGVSHWIPEEAPTALSEAIIARTQT